MDSSTVPSAATQVLTIKMRSVHVSVHIKGRDKGKSVCTLACKLHINVQGLLTETQTDIHEQKNVATQCNLLNAPTLELFPQASTSLDESLPLKQNHRRLIWTHHFVQSRKTT